MDTNTIQHPEIHQVALSQKQLQLRRLEQLFGIDDDDRSEVFTSDDSERLAFWQTRP